MKIKNHLKLSMRGLLFTGLVSGLILQVGCTPEFHGEYNDPNKIDVISDKWNETDARKTAEAMVKGMLSKPWLRRYMARNSDKRPIVIVDDIENRTDEHIDTETLTEFVRDELINSGQVRFVSKKAREKILAELKYQQSGHVSPDKARQGGRQIGAQFLLTGAISSNVQTQSRLKTVTYQTNLILTDIQTAEIVWSDNYRGIKKRFETARAAF